MGPFGNGAGAAGAGRNLPANSRLFGGSAAGVGGGNNRSAEHAKDSSFDTWRKQGGAGPGAGGASHPPGKPTSDSSGGGDGGSKGSSHWVPDFSRGSAGLASSAVPVGGGLPAELGASAGFSAGSGSQSSLAAAPLYPPRTPNAPATREVAPGEGKYRNGGGSGGEMFSDSAFSSFGASARFQPGGAHQPAGTGPFGAATAMDAQNIGGGFEEDNEEDDENPFA